MFHDTSIAILTQLAIAKGIQPLKHLFFLRPTPTTATFNVKVRHPVIMIHHVLERHHVHR